MRRQCDEVYVVRSNYYHNFISAARLLKKVGCSTDRQGRENGEWGMT